MSDTAGSLSSEQRLRLALEQETFSRRASGEGFRSGLAFHRYAVANNLGAPLARSAPGSQLISVDGRQYGYQVFARDTVYSDSANWSTVLSMNTLLNGKIPAGGLGRLLLEASYRAGAGTGGALHPEWASHPFAVAQRLGPPLAASRSIGVGGASYDIQVFACDTLCAPSGQPLALRRLSQIAPTDPLYGPLWTAACAAGGAPYDAQSPFLQAATRLGIGAPLGGAYAATLAGAAYQVQVFAADTLYAGADKVIRSKGGLPPLDFAAVAALPPPPPPAIPVTPPSPVAPAAPASAPAVVKIALAQLGKPYSSGSAGPTAFDCSGLVMWSYAQAGAGQLPHSAAMQHDKYPPIDQSQLQPGDLIFFVDPPGSGRVSHVGMYIGVDPGGKPAMVHAPYPGRTVEVVHDVFNAVWYKERIVGYARVSR